MKKLMFLFNLFVFALVGFLMTTFLFTLDITISLADIAWLMFFVIVSYQLVILTHEAGHLVFGKLSGFKLLSFRFLSFMIQNEGDGSWKFKRYSLYGTGGQCLMIPPKDKPMPVVLYNAGGVIVNLLWVGISLLVLFFAEGRLLHQFFVVFGLINLFVALLNWLPMGGLSNDGNNTREALRNPRSREAYANILNIHASLTFGESLSEIDVSAMPLDTLDKTKPLQLNEYLLQATQRLYQGHLDEYISLIQALKEGEVSGSFSVLVKPYVYFCELLEEPKEALQKEDKVLQRLLKNMKYEGFFALILWYQAFLRESSEVDQLRERFKTVAKEHPLRGEHQDLLHLQAILESKKLLVT